MTRRCGLGLLAVVVALTLSCRSVGAASGTGACPDGAIVFADIHDSDQKKVQMLRAPAPPPTPWAAHARSPSCCPLLGRGGEGVEDIDAVVMLSPTARHPDAAAMLSPPPPPKVTIAAGGTMLTIEPFNNDQKWVVTAKLDPVQCTHNAFDINSAHLASPFPQGQLRNGPPPRSPSRRSMDSSAWI